MAIFVLIDQNQKDIFDPFSILGVSPHKYNNPVWIPS